MRKVTTAVTQMACSWDKEKTLNTAEDLVRGAAEKGANIVLLQELFETPYFCQSHNFAYFNLAKTVEENTAIGSEPTLNIDSKPHWQRCMQGHAAANIMPVHASNRIGTETEKNTFGNSSMTFYGSSFITDETGAIVEEADRETEGVLTHTFDLDEIAQRRREWGVFRDRRPEMYHILTTHGR